MTTAKKGVSRGRPPKEDARDRAKAILEAAIESFAERGFDGTSLQEIASKAGVTEGLIRHYYGGRGALVSACNGRVLEEMRRHYESMNKRIGDAQGRDFIDAFVAESAGVFTSQPYLLRYLARLFSTKSGDSQEAFLEYFNIMRGHLDRIDASGELAPNSNKFWITVQLVLLQLGPALMKDSLEALINRDIYDSDVSRARVQQYANTLKFGVFADSDRKGPERD